MLSYLPSACIIYAADGSLPPTATNHLSWAELCFRRKLLISQTINQLVNHSKQIYKSAIISTGVFQSEIKVSCPRVSPTAGSGS